jgi:hypothetical protein
MHGTPVAADVLWVLVATAGLTAIGAPLALRMYRRER